MNGFLPAGKEGARGKPHNCQNPKGSAARGEPSGAGWVFCKTARLDISVMNIEHFPKNINLQNACASEIASEATANCYRPKAPVGFQPSLYPIISRHILEIEPPSFSAACATITANPQYRRQVEHLHEQGVRPLAELLAEITVAHGLEADISERLARFAAIPEDALDVTDGRYFPPDPMYEVSR